MVRAALGSSADPLDVAARAFARWRASGARRRLPPVLWARAVAAARAYGVGRAAQALRLNWSRLRAQVAGVTPRVRRPVSGPPAAFVELPPLPLPPGPACRVEVHDRRGRRVCVELTAPALPHLPEVLRALDGRHA